MDEKTKKPGLFFAVVLSGATLVIGMAIGYQVRPEGDHHGQTAASAHHDSAPAMKTLYTCGMHPEIISDAPGYCPKCDMKLTPMDADRAAMILEARGEAVANGPSTVSAGGPVIRIDPVTQQNMGVRYDVVRLGPLERSIRTVGTVEYDEQRLGTVTTKVQGWVEKVYVNQTGAEVQQGDPLFELYAPDLYSAQEEYIVALNDLRSAEEGGMHRAAELARARLDAARERLSFFDISGQQIEKLEAQRAIQKTITITAKVSGVVTEKAVTEGEFLMAGQTAYKIADLSTVWVIGKVYESDLPYVTHGQEARMELDYLPGQIYRGHVAYLYPYLEKGTREIPIRMEFDNSNHELKPGMYARINLQSVSEGEVILVPRSAVIFTGERQVAFVAQSNEPGKFELRELKTGLQSEGGEIEVLTGLAPGEMVVVSGQFLLDSESRLREATLKMMGSGPHDHSRAPAAAEMAPSEESSAAGMLYTCPMEEHAHIVSDKPERCPECNMKLIPTSEVDHGKVSEQHWAERHPK